MNPTDQNFRQANLIVKHLQGGLNDAEKKEHDNWLEADEQNRLLFDDITSDNHLASELRFFENISVDDAWQIVADQTVNQKKLRTISSQRFFWRSAAAAVLLAGVFVFYKTVFEKADRQEISNIAGVVSADILPGQQRALLALSDGSIINLDSSANGELASQGNVKVLKRWGSVTYQFSGSTERPVYNTIITPMGGQYQLILVDGTKVWLNDSSSLRFPTAFTGTSRTVELTGEGYFEVAHNASMPFRVTLPGKGEVEVLGTIFNINSYSDEATVNTTLLEGKVKMVSGSRSLLLAPGQQAQLSVNHLFTIKDHLNMEEITAWKNGRFIFNKLNIGAIMRQISRWYDVEVIYLGSKSQETFSGIVSRNSNLSKVLKIMEAGGVKFKVEGKKIMILN